MCTARSGTAGGRLSLIDAAICAATALPERSRMAIARSGSKAAPMLGSEAISARSSQATSETANQIDVLDRRARPDQMVGHGLLFAKSDTGGRSAQRRRPSPRNQENDPVFRPGTGCQFQQPLNRFQALAIRHRVARLVDRDTRQRAANAMPVAGCLTARYGALQTIPCNVSHLSGRFAAANMRISGKGSLAERVGFHIKPYHSDLLYFYLNQPALCPEECPQVNWNWVSSKDPCYRARASDHLRFRSISQHSNVCHCKKPVGHASGHRRTRSHRNRSRLQRLRSITDPHHRHFGGNRKQRIAYDEFELHLIDLQVAELTKPHKLADQNIVDVGDSAQNHENRKGQESGTLRALPPTTPPAEPGSFASGAKALYFQYKVSGSHRGAVTGGDYFRGESSTAAPPPGASQSARTSSFFTSLVS